jgi:hypothetical protein
VVAGLGTNAVNSEKGITIVGEGEGVAGGSVWRITGESSGTGTKSYDGVMSLGYLESTMER